MRKISWLLILSATLVTSCAPSVVDPLTALSKVQISDSYASVLKSMGSPSRVIYRKDGKMCVWIYSFGPKDAVVCFDRSTGLVNGKDATAAGAFTQEQWDKGATGNWGR